uniref:Hydrophobic surface binding protein A n=1 Tax=Musca domestica TaxID=7370 RepID=T1PGK9_MUSDO
MVFVVNVNSKSVDVSAISHGDDAEHSQPIDPKAVATTVAVEVTTTNVPESSENTDSTPADVTEGSGATEVTEGTETTEVTETTEDTEATEVTPPVTEAPEGTEAPKGMKGRKGQDSPQPPLTLEEAHQFIDHLMKVVAEIVNSVVDAVHNSRPHLPPSEQPLPPHLDNRPRPPFPQPVEVEN